MAVLPLTLSERLVSVNFRKTDIAGTSYFLLIDLSNPHSAYRHVNTNNLVLAATHATLFKSAVLDQWASFVGTILSIDENEATIGWTRFGTVGLRSTLANQETVTIDLAPTLLHLEVSEGDYTKIATNFKETVTSINLSTTMEDVAGNQVAPAVGDLICKVEKVSGVDTALVHYLIWYYAN